MYQPSKNTRRHRSSMLQLIDILILPIFIHQMVATQCLELYASGRQAPITPPAESALYILRNHCHTVAPKIHAMALLRRLEKGPHMDPVCS
jgi:hypothetical protein